jgi:hypothetical protein
MTVATANAARTISVSALSGVSLSMRVIRLTTRRHSMLARVVLEARGVWKLLHPFVRSGRVAVPPLHVTAPKNGRVRLAITLL